ncbi:MAG: type VI secretion system baseplate subunit TssE [Gemmataceae bacterium]
MPSTPNKEGRKPSILDRLIDPYSAGTAARPWYTLQQTLDVLRRDLENLLNAKRAIDGPPGLAKSIYCHGLPDLSNFTTETEDDRKALARLLDQTILAHEPRLRDVRTTMEVDQNTHGKRTVFRINAVLAVEPFDQVSFQTVLDLTTGHYIVS